MPHCASSSRSATSLGACDTSRSAACALCGKRSVIPPNNSPVQPLPPLWAHGTHHVLLPVHCGPFQVAVHSKAYHPAWQHLSATCTRLYC
jgi:hypothetical protein